MKRWRRSELLLIVSVFGGVACTTSAEQGTTCGGGTVTTAGATDKGAVSPGNSATTPESDGGTRPVSSSGGGDAGTTSAPPSSLGDAAPPAASRGASLPYWEYEAESATTTGTVLPPSRTFGDKAAEASGRSAVELDATGQSVTFKTAHPANSIVVRYSIPDAPGGGGATATLGLYVNGTRTASLALTSRYSWTYGDADAQGSGSENPGAGTAHHFYDEAHLLTGEIPAGATVALQRDSQDDAAFYVIDLVDFEEVPAPLAQPEGSLSITDYGATPDDGTDDSAAIRKAIAVAQAQNKVLFIPKGTFDQTAYDPSAQSTPKLAVSGITIRGAGMWYSVLKGFGAQFAVSGNNNQFYDFAVFGDVTYRDDTKGWQGFDGPAGTGSRMENVWIEHETAGWWVGKGAFVGQVTQPLTTGLVVHGVRIRDTYADGVNFADATKDSIVEQSSFRNTGDDSIATWSYTADGPAPCDGNVFRFNTVQAVWRANCLAIYGGSNNSMQDNTCADTSNYPGLLLSTTFSAIAFSGMTTVERNTLTRAGGPHYGQQFGALRVFADTAPVSGVNVSDIDIVSPTFSGIHFGGAQQASGITMSGVHVSDYGTVGVWVSSEAHGSAEMDNVTVTGALNKGLQNDAPNAFTLNRGSGDTGW